MLPNPDINKDALLSRVIEELTADGNTEVSWESIESLLAQKIAALDGNPKEATAYVQQVHDLEQEV